MNYTIATLFLLALLVRFISFLISSKNEKKLRASNAVEYGRFNTVLLIISHTFIYLSCLVEAYIRKTQFDSLTVTGFLLLLLSIFVLFIIIQELKDVWTFKVYIARDHSLNNSFIFKYLKHPNYFLNVIPELLGVILICKAWYVLIILFPIHMMLLTVRIFQEENAMRQKFSEY